MAFAPVRKLLDKGMPSAASFASVRDRMGRRPSNSALAEYLKQEQARLKAEQARLDELVQAFEAFKSAERQAADKRDFDEFLRAREASGVDDLAPGDAPRS